MTKLYTDVSGTFQMFVPVTWENQNLHWKNQKSPHSFSEYDDFVGAFQISCQLINNNLTLFISSSNLKKQEAESISLQFQEILFQDQDIVFYTWICHVEDHLFLITYNLSTETSESQIG